MKVIDYFNCDRPEHWLRQIKKSDWDAGQYLYELISKSLRLFLLLFTLSATVPIFSCGYVSSYGLFGEMKSFVAVNENKEEISEVSSKITVQRKQKGKNILNVWFLLLANIVCLLLLAHSIKLPKADTIFAKKVRMNI